MFGLLITAYSIFQFFAAPFFGALSDAYGRKKLLVLSQLGTLISQVIVGIAFLLPDTPLGPIALPLWVLLLARIIDGITGGNVSVANAYIADMADKKQKAHAYSLMGASIGVAMVIGPVIGWFASNSQLGYAGVALVATLISFITLWLLILQLKESLPQEHRHTLTRKQMLSKINLWKQYKNCVTNRFIHKLFILQITLGFVFAAFISTNVWYATDYLWFDNEAVGLMYLAVGVMMVIHQVVFVRWLVNRYGALRSYYLANFLLAGWLIGYSIEPWVIVFFVLAFFITLGISLGIATSKSLLSNNAAPRHQWTVLGLDESFLALNRALAPIFASALFAQAGLWAFVVLGIFLLLPWVLSKTVRENILKSEA